MAENSAAPAAGGGALSELLVSDDVIYKSLVPEDVVIRDFLSCINDDTWVRHAELVHLSDLKESPHEEAVKEEVLRTYMEERRRSNAELPRDLIMEGILWQERFMDEYKREHRTQDKEEASNYKQSLIERFRRRRSNPRIHGGVASDVKAIEDKRKQADGANVSLDSAAETKQRPCDQPPSMYTPVVLQEQPEAAAPTTIPAPVTSEYLTEGQMAPAAGALQDPVDAGTAAVAVEAPHTPKEYLTEGKTLASDDELSTGAAEIHPTTEI